jgi:phage recombination protein Bet
MNALTQHSGSVLIDMSQRYGMAPDAFELTVRATCSPKGKDSRPLTREEFAAFLLVAREHRLNPLLREIYAFPAKGGGIVPVVSVDGWINLVNSHQAFDGMEFSEEHNEQGGLVSIECTLWRKDRGRPTKVREHLKECYRDTDAWKMTHRMLRHKALIQTARYAFGFAGIYDEEEAMVIAEAKDVTPVKRVPPSAPARVTGVKLNEQVDDQTGEVTQTRDAVAESVDEQATADRQGKVQTRAKASSPTRDVGGADTDSSGAAHQGAQRDAAPTESPTHPDEIPDTGGAIKAFNQYARDLGDAKEADDAEGIRDGYLAQFGMLWTRAQKEQAAHLYSIALTRIEAAEADAARDEPEEDFPGDTPAPQGAPQAATEPAQARKPPRAPITAEKPAFNPAMNEPVNGEQYEAVFNARLAQVDSREKALHLKSWWYSSSSLRGACGISADKVTLDRMRDKWMDKLNEFPG